MLLIFDSGHPGIHYVDLAGLEFTDLPLPPNARIKGFCHNTPTLCSNVKSSHFLSFPIQVNPPPSSVTQHKQQRWHPDEDDEEFTANEDEGQTCFVFFVVVCFLGTGSIAYPWL